MEVKFKIDRIDRVNTFLTLNGQPIRFAELEVISNPSDPPMVKVAIFASLIEGEIVGGKGELKIIHLDDTKKGLVGPDEEIRRSGWQGPGGEPDGCPASSLKDQGES